MLSKILILLFLFSLAFAAPMPAQQSVLPMSSAINPAQTTFSSGGAHALRLSAGDLLDVKVLGTTDPDFSPKLRVDEQGSISLPYAGSLPVAGLTAEDAALRIEARFREKDILKD